MARKFARTVKRKGNYSRLFNVRDLRRNIASYRPTSRLVKRKNPFYRASRNIFGGHNAPKYVERRIVKRIPFNGTRMMGTYLRNPSSVNLGVHKNGNARGARRRARWEMR